MKKLLLMAAVLCLGSVCLTSCGDEDEEQGNLKPVVIDDSEGNLVQVRKAGPYTITYDAYDQFDGFMANGNSFHVDEKGNLKFSYNDFLTDEDGEFFTNQFTMNINDRGLVSMIDFKLQVVYDEDEEIGADQLEHRIVGKIVYGYDKNRQVTGMSTKINWEEITTLSGVKICDQIDKIDIRHTTTWKNGLLTAFEAKEKTICEKSELVNDKWEDMTWNEELTTNGTIDYGTEKNEAKQMPATLFNIVFCDMCIPMFAPIGMYGAGPANLPASCTVYEQAIPRSGIPENDQDEYSFHFKMNDNGTIDSEWTDDEEPTEYQYTVTRAIGEEEAKHIVAGLKRLAKRK